MLVLGNSIIGFQTGDVLAPSDLARHYDQVNDLIKDIGGQRYAHSVMTCQMVQDCNTPLTNTDYSADVERCRLRFAIPNAAVVDLVGVYVNANYTASNGIDGYLLQSNGLPPTNVFNPIFTLPTLSSVSDTPTSEVALQPLTLSNGTDYIIELRPSIPAGTFSLERCDITLDFKTDLFTFTAIDTLDDVDYLFTEADAPDATRVSSINSAITTAVAAINNNRTAYRPCFVRWNNFTNATSANVLRIELPRAATGKKCTLDRAYFWAIATAATTATVSITLQDSSGATLSHPQISLVSQRFGSTGEFQLSQSMVGTNGAIDTSEDFRIVASTSAGTIYSLYGVLWYK